MKLSIWPNWIPVVVADGAVDESCLPISPGLVVVCSLSGDVSVAHYSGLFHAPTGEMIDVTHWAPLPDPPSL